MTRPLRIGLGGPVGSGKTALIEALVPRLVAHGHAVGVVTNDIYSTEDAQRLEWSLTSTLDASHLVGVQMGAARTRPCARTRRPTSRR